MALADQIRSKLKSHASGKLKSKEFQAWQKKQLEQLANLVRGLGQTSGVRKRKALERYNKALATLANGGYAEQLVELHSGIEHAPALLAVLGHHLSEPRKTAFEALAKLGPALAPHAPVLAKALEHSNWDVRYDALRTLARVGPAALPFVPNLEALIEKHGLQHEDPARSASLEALRSLGTPKAHEILARYPKRSEFERPE